MDKESRRTLIRYAVCIGVGILIGFLVVWSKGFFAHSAAVNLQILADAFFVPGILMTLFAGMLYVSDGGALIGIGFVLRNVALAFIPMGRTKHETYADYRARKLGQPKHSANWCILVTGLIFLAVGITLTVIWAVKYYQFPA